MSDGGKKPEDVKGSKDGLEKETSGNGGQFKDDKANKRVPVYHEVQSRQLCAMHVLNCLFQRPEFDQAQLDNICRNLSPDAWINPHKSMLGLGNYDVNVVMSALQGKDYETKWFDKRK